MTNKSELTEAIGYHELFSWSWLGIPVLIATLIKVSISLLRYAVRDEIKAEVATVKTDLMEKIKSIETKLEKISKNTHTIRNSEVAEEGTLLAVLERLEHLDSTLKEIKNGRRK